MPDDRKIKATISRIISSTRPTPMRYDYLKMVTTIRARGSCPGHTEEAKKDFVLWPQPASAFDRSVPGYSLSHDEQQT
jgi:hypothetical protein